MHGSAPSRSARTAGVEGDDGRGKWQAHPRDDRWPRKVGLTCLLLAAVLAWPAAVLWGQALNARSSAASAGSERSDLAAQQAEMEAATRADLDRLTAASLALSHADASLAEIAASQEAADVALATVAANPPRKRKKAVDEERERLVSELGAALARQQAAVDAWNRQAVPELSQVETSR